jgi:hypothetical protein
VRLKLSRFTQCAFQLLTYLLDTVFAQRTRVSPRVHAVSLKSIEQGVAEELSILAGASRSDTPNLVLIAGAEPMVFNKC